MQRLAKSHIKSVCVYVPSSQYLLLILAWTVAAVLFATILEIVCHCLFPRAERE